MADQDRRAALAAAFETDETDTEVVTPDPAPAPTPEFSTEQPDAYKAEAKAAAAPEGEAPKTADPTDTTTPAQETKPPVTDDSATAPISWTKEEKLHWGKTPPEVRAVISRRELETQRALSTSAQARRFSEDFGRVVSPYAHLIRAQNSNPLQAVENLMRTAGGLTVGTQEQKAAIVAEIIGNYGVDIGTLDAVLSKSPVPQNSGQQSMNPQFAQMLQPVYQFMEQVQNGRQQYEAGLQAKADQDIATFGANKPYFAEVREEMADLIEVAAKRGKNLSLEQAYNAAIAGNPEYTQAQRQKDDVSAAAATLARARRAASSITGAPNGGSMVPKTPADRRGALEAAWDSNSP